MNDALLPDHRLRELIEELERMASGAPDYVAASLDLAATELQAQRDRLKELGAL